MRTEPEANGFRAEFAVLRPRGVYIYVGGRKRQKNKKRLKMRKTEGFQPLFLKTNTKTNERRCILSEEFVY